MPVYNTFDGSRCSNHSPAVVDVEAQPLSVKPVRPSSRQYTSFGSAAAEAPPRRFSFKVSSSIFKSFSVGLSDGSIVSAGMVASLSAMANPTVILGACSSGMISGALSRGLGQFVAAYPGIWEYEKVFNETRRSIYLDTDVAAAETDAVFRQLGLPNRVVAPLVEALVLKPETWVQWKMEMEHKLKKPAPLDAAKEGIWMFTGYPAGGFPSLIDPSCYIPAMGQAHDEWFGHRV